MALFRGVFPIFIFAAVVSSAASAQRLNEATEGCRQAIEEKFGDESIQNMKRRKLKLKSGRIEMRYRVTVRTVGDDVQRYAVQCNVTEKGEILEPLTKEII